MKTFLWATSLAVLATLLLASPVRAVNPVNYNAGRYVGTMQIITTDTFDPFVKGTSTIKLKGRSDGSDSIRLVGTPQHAMPAVADQTDDFPMKVFVLGRFGAGDQAVLGEFHSMDSDGNSASTKHLTEQTVAKNTIDARLSYQRTFGGVTFTITVIIKLSRLKP